MKFNVVGVWMQKSALAMGTVALSRGLCWRLNLRIKFAPFRDAAALNQATRTCVQKCSNTSVDGA